MSQLQGSKRVKWWIGAVIMFSLMADIGLYLMGSEYTISRQLQSEYGGHGPALVLGFVLGGLFVHFFEWKP